jgi:hypothetical protein
MQENGMLPTLGLCLTLLWQGALTGCTAIATESQFESNRIAIRGRVVDDETGEPIESFTLEWGRVKGQDPAEASWGGSRRSVPGTYTIVDGKAIPTGRNPLGEFADSLAVGVDGTQHRGWLRVVADGYEPRPVTDRPPEPTDGGKAIEVTVRLKRGRPLIGRVLDHTGRPAAGAKLFLIRPSGGTVRVVDDTIGEGSDTGLLDPAVTRTVADEKGRFRITGVGDATAIGVSASTLHLWTVPIPPGEEPTIRLPEPATIRLPYAIDGDEAEAAFQLLFLYPKHPNSRLWGWRNLRVANGGEIVLRDATPGEAVLFRMKMLTHGDYRGRVSVERRTITVTPGGAVVVDFARERGARIEGEASGPEGEQSRMIFVGIEPVDASVPADGSPGSPRQLLDIVACGEDGRFRTARIPPGEYVAHAVGYRTQPRYGPFVPGIELFDFSGSARVTVPPDGDPPAVRIVVAGPKRQIGPAK